MNILQEPKSKQLLLLEHGARVMQELDPVRSFSQHLISIFFVSGDIRKQVIVHMYLNSFNEEYSQALLYEGSTAGSRLIGMQYIISERVFQSLPEEEKKIYHSFFYLVKNGLIIAPHMPSILEKPLMRRLASCYGKTFLFWEATRTQLPPGIPYLMMTPTGEGQIDDTLLNKLFEAVDKRPLDLLRKRRKIQTTVIHPGCDIWQQRAYQLKLEPVPETSQTSSETTSDQYTQSSLRNMRGDTSMDSIPETSSFNNLSSNASDLSFNSSNQNLGQAPDYGQRDRTGDFMELNSSSLNQNRDIPFVTLTAIPKPFAQERSHENPSHSHNGAENDEQYSTSVVPADGSIRSHSPISISSIAQTHCSPGDETTLSPASSSPQKPSLSSKQNQLVSPESHFNPQQSIPSSSTEYSPKDIPDHDSTNSALFTPSPSSGITPLFESNPQHTSSSSPSSSSSSSSLRDQLLSQPPLFQSNQTTSFTQAQTMEPTESDSLSLSSFPPFQSSSSLNLSSSTPSTLLSPSTPSSSSLSSSSTSTSPSSTSTSTQNKSGQDGTDQETDPLLISKQVASSKILEKTTTYISSPDGGDPLAVTTLTLLSSPQIPFSDKSKYSL